ncbi:alpha/beta fold hydrolase [uncultured Psychroserpens sp.]|uniref:alpha/beta fold hydrolase n=1 Tax=uncultured Psychroserpens sp. TaxID=255436 RepID=UPI00261CE8F5|nr:alpha/beta fold hydrolase [uncultured Psychroserpens sp.]
MRLIIFLLILLSSVESFTQNEQLITLENSKISFTVFGKGTPLLIINGGPGMNSQGFSDLAKELGKTHKVIIYDQRGTGKSKIDVINSNTMTLDLMLEDIETIRTHINVKEWVILGHSFGGMLASYYATKFPKRIKALILSSSGGLDVKSLSSIQITSKLTQKQRDSLSYWTNKIRRGDTSYHAKFQRGKYLAPAYLRDLSYIKRIAHRLTQVNFEINQLIFQNMNAIDLDCSNHLKSFQKPVLIIQGKQDIIPIEISQKTHRTFPNSKLKIIANSGHYGWLDQPKIYYKSISDFLKSINI